MGAPRIRCDLHDAIQTTLNRIADCGTWWSGAERVAIVETSWRALNALRDGDVEALEQRSTDVLPEAAVEAAQLIAVAPQSLDEGWCRSARERLDAGQLVELIALVSVSVTLDTLYRVVGLPRPTLPSPRPGSPSRYLPKGVQEGVCWVPTIDPDRVGSSEVDLFPGHGRPNIGRPLTLVPDAWRLFDRLMRPAYLPFHVVPNVHFDAERAISRRQMEMIATRVSSHNECFY